MRRGSRSLALWSFLTLSGSGAAACGAFSGASPEPSTEGTADATADAVSEGGSGFDADAGATLDAEGSAGVVFKEGFETTLDCPGWLLSGVSVSRETTTVHSGSGSCKVCVDSTGGDMSRTITAKAAVPHQLEVWVRGDALTFAADIWFVADADAGNEGYLASGGKSPDGSTWTKVVTSTVPSVGSALTFRLDFNGASKQCVTIDDVVIRTQ